MHAMFGAPPGGRTRAFCRPREMITLKNAASNNPPCLAFSSSPPAPPPLVREVAPQRKRADRVIECYAREELTARAQTVAWRKNVKNAPSIYLMSITTASTLGADTAGGAMGRARSDAATTLHRLFLINSPIVVCARCVLRHV